MILTKSMCEQIDNCEDKVLVRSKVGGVHAQQLMHIPSICGTHVEATGGSGLTRKRRMKTHFLLKY